MDIKFYRYVAVVYASIGIDGEYESPLFPNPKLELHTYDLFKETPKGYWIGHTIYKDLKLREYAHWVSKSARKRFAYPTKKEALENYIKRTEKRIKILSRQIDICKTSLGLAKNVKIVE